MIAILQSIHPQWCASIVSNKKSIEVRRIAQKLKPPFKVYIYCTKPKERFLAGSGVFYHDELYRLPTGEIRFGSSHELWADGSGQYSANNILNGKVIGEYICDAVYTWQVDPQSKGYFITKEELAQTCLSQDQLYNYGHGKTLYGWNITNLVIYNQPKSLTTFTKPHGAILKAFESRFIQKPPQNYCYVEELSA